MLAFQTRKQQEKTNEPLQHLHGIYATAASTSAAAPILALHNFYVSLNRAKDFVPHFPHFPLLWLQELFSTSSDLFSLKGQLM